jgi:hypothetical protein
MNRHGRINVLAIGVIVGLVLLSALFLLSRDGIAQVSARFMNALAQGNVDQLTQLTYLGDRKPEEIKAKWQYTVNDASKYYRFRWKIVLVSETGPDMGAARLQVIRNSDSMSSYEENFSLPLVRVDGVWKVDVANISRDMFPSLPRY